MRRLIQSALLIAIAHSNPVGAETLSMPTPAQVDAAAAKATTVLASPELHTDAVANHTRILKAMPLATPQSGVLDKLFSQVEAPQFPALQQAELLVLVSFSMPKEALQNLAQQADKAGAVLVLRGLVEDSLDKTAKAIQAVVEPGADATFQVNPNVFRAYGVQDVPSFVIAKSPAKDDSTCEPGTDYVAVRGDVTLEYALRKLGENPSFAATAGRYLQALGGKP
ncbi:type-F conjugative transfer system pilin assembly protein TrbC [Thiothrix winogradskyi]|uniref:Type-F conjugative transfer system pilin assembly protein TrbC n=1 Tax=Thiothrix winogradskyi TaxID=96472 RepID=A0ABY3T4B7_9GAMM|nr:type-F conjugative transfer system pilin assembly protein TrbC [Thiothrix winogradskyi]UJS26416.1 type-F conjugative transfer system pilin assembly protein TrbC [Thiothrix winogradskyi]